MKDIRQVMRKNFLEYASYVVLERAIPNVFDGLKPVQRRILATLHKMHDGKMHKVANVAGQTMALHPHGDAPITDALVQLANKGFLLETQGNFGNLYTGDPAAASRYIETRLSPLAIETMFNPDLTAFSASYDGRQKEPISLPAKIPILLMQGVEGIAVGMATKIFPHNFVELLEAEIAFLEEKKYTLFPDFSTGGIMDAEEYDKGRGKIKLRAKIEIRDPKTLVVREICYGTTTESLIRSIDEAAKKGKIKIDSISDYTSDKVEIEITLPRGQYATDLIDALYAYTDCEVTLHSQPVVIQENLPAEIDVHDMIALHAKKLQDYLRRELEIERGRLLEKIFHKSLEQIFIENRLYKKIETIAKYEKIHQTIEKSLTPFHKQLLRIPTEEDRERLLNIPIRRISRFDIEKNQEEIVALQKQLVDVENRLKSVKKETIHYLKHLIKKYGKAYPRKTKIGSIEELDLRAIKQQTIKVGLDPQKGFLGTKISGENAIMCTNYDKILLLFDDGTYQVVSIPEKKYVLHKGAKIIYFGVADKKTGMSVVYRDPKTHMCYGKRFVVTKFILEKEYRYFPEEMQLQLLTTEPNERVELRFVPKQNQRVTKSEVKMSEIPLKGVSARGIRLANREVKKVVRKK